MTHDEIPTPSTDALCTFLVTQFPATVGNIQLDHMLRDLQIAERELDEANQENTAIRLAVDDGFLATFDENAKLRIELAAMTKERDRLRAAVEWISNQQDLFFAECSQAEEIIAKCGAALTPSEASETSSASTPPQTPC